MESKGSRTELSTSQLSLFFIDMTISLLTEQEGQAASSKVSNRVSNRFVDFSSYHKWIWRP
jgi:hypothetical protein